MIVEELDLEILRGERCPPSVFLLLYTAQYFSSLSLDRRKLPTLLDQKKMIFLTDSVGNRIGSTPDRTPQITNPRALNKHIEKAFIAIRTTQTFISIRALTLDSTSWPVNCPFPKPKLIFIRLLITSSDSIFSSITSPRLPATNFL